MKFTLGFWEPLFVGDFFLLDRRDYKAIEYIDFYLPPDY